MKLIEWAPTSTPAATTTLCSDSPGEVELKDVGNSFHYIVTLQQQAIEIEGNSLSLSLNLSPWESALDD